MEYKDVLPYQQRVVDEKVELDAKIAKLKDFINESPMFGKLSLNEQKRLQKQYVYMDNYSDILGFRINAFGTEE